MRVFRYFFLRRWALYFGLLAVVWRALKAAKGVGWVCGIQGIMAQENRLTKGKQSDGGLIDQSRFNRLGWLARWISMSLSMLTWV
jgi:hypothetical protein